MRSPSYFLYVSKVDVHAGSPDYRFDVHLRTLSTNEPHPKALVPILTSAFRDTDLIPPIMIMRVEISGNMLALLYVDMFESCKVLEIWNWAEFPHHSVRSLLLFQSGGFTKRVTHQCMVKNGPEVEEFIFILHDTVLVARSNGVLEVLKVITDSALESIMVISQACYSLPRPIESFKYYFMFLGRTATMGTAYKDTNLGVYERMGAGGALCYPRMDERILCKASCNITSPTHT